MKRANIIPDYTTTFRNVRAFDHYFRDHNFAFTGSGFYLGLNITVLALAYSDNTAIEAYVYDDSFDKTIFTALQNMPTRQFAVHSRDRTIVDSEAIRRVNEAIRRVNDALIARHRVEVPRDEPELNARDE